MKKRLLFLVFAFSSLCAFSQKNYWKPVSSSEASKLNKGKALFNNGFQPAEYKLFTLDEPVFRTLMAKAPYEKTVNVKTSSFIISIPVADGKIERFRLVEAPVMQPKLQARYSNIRSYSGIGIDNPGSVIRCSLTPLGFHVMIRSVNRPTIYLNTVNNQAKLYAVNTRNINDNSENKLKCETDGLINEAGKTENKVTFEGNSNDGMMRVFRLALCSTGEFSRFQLTGIGGSTEDSIAIVLAALNVYLTRANLLYENDLGIRMVFVDNEDTLIFLNPATDPFTNSTLNSKCQQTCDTRIGNANYDIGHVLQKGGDNGNAGCIACVCKTGSKGSGFSTYSKPDLVDYFVIDYWTHEMGHQYGANHTFTYTNEGTAAQIEPGSGSTIMGYAGITGNTDVQPHSDDYFSTASLAQISEYIKSVKGSCSVNSISGNTAPTANAGADYTIPRSTPFTLTGFGADVDAPDVLSYVWEQIDAWETGSSAIPKPTNTKGPMFRSTLYSPSASRTFPALNSILNGTNTSKWEVLPSVARDMNFRIVVRDNNGAGGNTASDNVTVTVAGTTGPFRITAPNTAVTIGEGSTQTIEWDVANTDAAPVNCGNVKISLSLNGGLTFPYVLSASTPNDGSEEITIPLIPASTNTARIKIEAVGNIFFDINDSDFSIEGTLPLTWLSFTAQKVGTNNALLSWATANELNNDHFEIERSPDGVNFTTIGKVVANTQHPTSNNYTYSDNLIPKGIYYYRIKQVGNDGRFTYSVQMRITVDASGISWIVMPNPASDHVTITLLDATKLLSITMSDASGKTVYTNNNTVLLNNTGRAFNIPLRNFANGIYFIKVTTETGSRVEKLVIEK